MRVLILEIHRSLPWRISRHDPEDEREAKKGGWKKIDFISIETPPFEMAGKRVPEKKGYLAYVKYSSRKEGYTILVMEKD